MQRKIYFTLADILTLLAGMTPRFTHCRRCGAQPGDFCHTESGRRSADDHEARKEIVGLGICPRCDAFPGEYCVADTGRPAPPHAVRLRITGRVSRPNRPLAQSWPGRIALVARQDGATTNDSGIAALFRRWLRIVTPRRTK